MGMACVVPAYTRYNDGTVDCVGKLGLEICGHPTEARDFVIIAKGFRYAVLRIAETGVEEGQ